MTAIEQYLSELKSCLRVGGRERTRILAEVRDHLEDATAHREQAGEQHDPAIAHAVNAFGSPPAIGTEFNAQAGVRAMRRAPFVLMTAGFVIFAGLLIAANTQPHETAPLHASLATQTSFFIAVLAFQIAVVAGICAASRALALWRSPTTRGQDRQFVGRCATVSTAALGVAAASWATALGLELNRLAHRNTATGVAGAAAMIGAAGAAMVIAWRLRINPFDDSGDARDDTNSVFGLGERALGLVRVHPVTSCLAVAALSGWAAMVHAETTFTGALPWGLTQVATVVLAFAALGPTLGLRTPRST